MQTQYVLKTRTRRAYKLLNMLTKEEHLAEIKIWPRRGAQNQENVCLVEAIALFLEQKHKLWGFIVWFDITTQ